MNRTKSLTLATVLTMALAWAALAMAQAQSQPSEPQTGPKLSAEQQKQFDQLKQLEQQLQKDRSALHDAIAQYGRDSDQADQAQEQLMRDRLQYRKLRRSLRAQGVPVPAPPGIGPRGPRAGGWRAYGRGFRRGWGMHGCPCCPYRNMGRSK